SLRAADDRARTQRASHATHPGPLAGGPPARAARGLQARGLRPPETTVSEDDDVEPVMPPPVRRIALDRDPHIVAPGPLTERAPDGRAPSLARALAKPSSHAVERMRVESVWLAYGDNWVVRDVSLGVRAGEVLGLIGASGSGKTTLLRSLNRLTEVTAGAARAGRITLDGAEIHELEVTDLRRRVPMVFQQPNPSPMSIFDNVAYALAERRGGGRRRRRTPQLQNAVQDALTRAGLWDEVGDDLERSALRLSG